MIRMKGSKAGLAATQSRKESAEAARGLMTLSKRELAEAKHLRDQAAKVDPAKREELMKEAMEKLQSSREFAEEARRLVAE